MDATRPPDRVKLREGAAAWREVDGETILLDLSTSEYLGVNRTGTVLWPSIVVGTTRTELVDHLIAEFGVDRREGEADVDAFLRACEAHNLLER